jgi:hypothetical protein
VGVVPQLVRFQGWFVTIGCAHQLESGGCKSAAGAHAPCEQIKNQAAKYIIIQRVKLSKKSICDLDITIPD